MCEIFGITASRKIELNELLTEFFSHYVENPNGWGIATLDHGNISVEKEPLRVRDSLYLKHRLQSKIKSAHFFAHIRRATIGDINFENTHPFTLRDNTGRNWLLVHNGTIFEAPVLNKYQSVQEGSTDSERVLYYIVDRINNSIEENWNSFDANDRIRLIEDILRELSPNNKLNVIISDAEYTYVHKNAEGTLFRSDRDDAVLFSTKPLDLKSWEEVPNNTLFVYREGKVVYTGKQHEFSYVEDPEKIKNLFLSYSYL